MRLILFDTETTGLPKTREPALKGAGNWPHIVSLAWIVMENDTILKEEYRLIKPEGWTIPSESTKIHGITQEYAERNGTELRHAVLDFLTESGDLYVCHNVEFDKNVIANAMLWDLNLPFRGLHPIFCTMQTTHTLCKIPFTHGGGGYKFPKLKELYTYVFHRDPPAEQLHNSLGDTRLLVDILRKCTLLRTMIGLPTPGVILAENDRPASNKGTLSISFA